MNGRALVRECVRQMAPYVPGEQPQDPRILKLNTNENPYPPSPRVGEALEGLNVADLRRYPDPYCRELRHAIARIHAVDADAVFIGNGSDEVLSLCVRAFVEPPGAVGFFDPSYSLYPVLAAAHGLFCRPSELGPAFEWRMPEHLDDPLFLLTSPNAPTGLAYPLPVIRGFCEAFKGVVVLDEAYADFADENGMELAKTLENVLVCRSLSKSYSLAGLRVGYAVGPLPLINALNILKDSYNLGRMEQRMALAAVQDQECMRRNVERIRDTRERIGNALAQMGFNVTPSSTNFLWIRHNQQAAVRIFQRLRENGILVRYFPGRLTGEHLRVTVGTDADMDRFVEGIRSVL